MSSSLIIGASRGLGLEFVRQLRTRPGPVLATARERAGLDRLESLGAQALELDVAEPDAFVRLAAGLESVDLDLVILNAGAFGPREGATQAPDRDVFDRIMRTNVFAALQGIPALAPLLARTRGRFVAITSDMASIGGLQSSMGLSYRASKAALNMVIRAAALDHPEVAFLAQSPGWVRTDMGGPEAPLEAEESVSTMLRNIDGFAHDRSGSYLALDGTPLPW